MLKAINNPDINIMTVEDRVEYRLPGMTQVQVNPGIGLSFGSVLRSVLRQDPDVILSVESVTKKRPRSRSKRPSPGIAYCRASTPTAPRPRCCGFLRWGSLPNLTASAVRLIFAQRLLRGLCPGCRAPAAMDKAHRAHLTDAEAESLREARQRGGGCDRCGQTGYAGRIAAFEVMPVRSPQFRQAICQSIDLDVLAGFAAREGMSICAQRSSFKWLRATHRLRTR